MDVGGLQVLLHRSPPSVLVMPKRKAHALGWVKSGAGPHIFTMPYQGLEPKYFKVSWLAEHVLGVGIQRPPVNAFDTATWTEMHAIFSRIRVDGDVRAVVLYGEGRCFTAGLDLRDPALMDVIQSGGDPARRSMAIRELIERFQNAISSIEQCERPVMGVSHSFTVGLGIDILSAVDVRYASKDARFSIREARIGLAADIGTLQRFPKIVGNESWAREVAFTARDFGADEARAMGFVSQVFATQQEAMLRAVETAKQIASLSPVAVVGTKLAMVHARDHSVDEGLRYMQYLNGAFLQTEDLVQAITATMSKTQPTFAKL